MKTKKKEVKQRMINLSHSCDDIKAFVKNTSIKFGIFGLKSALLLRLIRKFQLKECKFETLFKQTISSK